MSLENQDISKLGPRTKQPLFPDLVLCDGICGTETWYRIIFGITFLADLVLTILHGLDAVDKGPNTPWIPFIFSAVIAITYSILLVVAVIISYWDRLLEFKCKWVFINLITTVVMWTSFAFIASWITWYGSNSKKLSSDDPAFISWIAINATAVVLFLLRFIGLVLVFGFQYVYMRSIELSSYAALAGKHGKNLNDYLLLHQEEAAGLEYVGAATSTVPITDASRFSSILPQNMHRPKAYLGSLTSRQIPWARKTRPVHHDQ